MEWQQFKPDQIYFLKIEKQATLFYVLKHIKKVCFSNLGIKEIVRMLECICMFDLGSAMPIPKG